MAKTEKNRLLIKSVLKTCKILSLDENRLFTSLELEAALNNKATDNIRLQREDILLLAKFTQVYRFLDVFCGSNREFICHWIDTENEYFDASPRECFYTRSGIQRLYEYVQRFN